MALLRSIALLFSLAHAAPATLFAQAPETPPELKDFRLDEPKPEPPKADPPPPATPKFEPPKPEPPVAKPVVETRPAFTPPRKAAARDGERPVADRKARQAARPTEKVDSGDVAKASESASLPAPVSDPIKGAASTAVTPTMPWLPYAGGGALALLLLIAWMARRYVRARRAAYQDEEYGDAAPDIADDGQLLDLDESQAELQLVRHAAPPPPELVLTDHDPGEMRASFDPSFASLSMANLTVTGKLTILNPGTQAISSLKVRTLMMSACENQKATIDAFHEDRSRGHGEDIGDAQPGEEIALTLEIQVPRSDMQAFDWRERRFVAPIVLINLFGRSADGPHECRLSCLLGREAIPPSPRMKPFHIDRGPRRFDGLGVRPAVAFA